MTVTINKGARKGAVSAPPSKSMAHRYLICAALSGGSEIGNIAFSEDIKATLSCLNSLGAKAEINGDIIALGGIDFKNLKGELNCNESGSTLRFMIPLCLLFGKEITLKGTERLLSRSLSVYEGICRKQGIEFKVNKTYVSLNGRLKAGNYKVRGDISSQFISGLMFALPLLEEDSTIEITGDFESSSYVNLTIEALNEFGIEIERKNNIFYIKGNQTYYSRNLFVEGDYSNAAFFDALNLLGGEVAVSGLKENSAQGDLVYIKLFEQLKNGTPRIDISNCPDLGPILMAVAAALNGAHFTGTKRLKIKESDRGTAMAKELSKFGVNVKVNENDIIVEKCRLKAPSEPLCGHNDHRIVMSLAVLCTLTGGVIEGAEAVAKSFPNFFEIFFALQEVK